MREGDSQMSLLRCHFSTHFHIGLAHLNALLLSLLNRAFKGVVITQPDRLVAYSRP